jgi:uncharacterized protein
MIDDHCHPFALEPGPLDLSHVSLELLDDPGAATRRARLRPTYLWHNVLCNRLARYLGVPVDDLETARAAAAKDYRAYVRGLFADAGLHELIMDPAWPPGAAERVAEYQDLTGCPVHRLLRIDQVIDRLLEEQVSFEEFVRRFDQALEEARAEGYRGFKTILAYRTGLGVDVETSAGAAQAALPGSGPLKRRAKPLRDFLARRLVRYCADVGLPVQFHTGLGDSDIRLQDANPLLLEHLLRTPEGTTAQIVLIHGSYPYHEEAAYLAAARPNVYVDVSLFNIFAPARIADRMVRLIELAPTARILAGTDGFAVPETFWFAATLTHEAWSDARDQLARIGADEAWLQMATQRVFEENARQLYGL